VTILIAARNASATIERAVSSCLKEEEQGARLVLIDDHSTDDTVQKARAVAGSRLRIVRTRDPGGIAMARQAGLDAVETEFAAWLDADDEWVPGRMARLGAMLGAGYDVAVEAIDLFDGPSGAPLRRLTAPAFLRVPGGPVRLFERNFLPGDTQVAFRVSEFREAGGYDPGICGPESFDLLLRAIRRGATFAFGDEVGYRMHAYPGSLSRDVARQSKAIAAALGKHDYADVQQLYRATGHSVRVAAWGLVSMALFRHDVRSALQFLDDASPAGIDPLEVLEPDGPWPLCEGWRRAFHRGTILLLMGHFDGEAEKELRLAEAMDPTPEGANNLGVALMRLGRTREAADRFASAEARFPGYYDARVNAAAAAPSRITTHALRRVPSRNDYFAAPSSSRPAIHSAA
jgi:glycosyltransferase involved in cell wall biosynthesis